MDYDRDIELLTDALDFIKTFFNSAKSQYKLDPWDSPPMVAYLRILEDGEVLWKHPDTLSNTPPVFWSEVIREGKQNTLAEGFVLWFVAGDEDTPDGSKEDKLVVALYTPSMTNPLCIEMTLDFEDMKVIPENAGVEFLNADYEQEVIGH